MEPFALQGEPSYRGETEVVPQAAFALVGDDQGAGTASQWSVPDFIDIDLGCQVG